MFCIKKRISKLFNKSGNHCRRIKLILDKDTPNLGRMEVSLNGFYGADVVGLERPEFTNVRTTLRAYMNAVLFNTNPNSKSMIVRH